MFSRDSKCGFKSHACLRQRALVEQAADQRDAVGHAARRRELRQRMRRVGRPVAARLRTSTNPARSVSDGWPVKLVIVSISSRSDGTSSKSTCESIRAISCATLRRKRSACTKSTAERNRAWRNKVGPRVGTCTFN